MHTNNIVDVNRTQRGRIQTLELTLKKISNEISLWLWIAAILFWARKQKQLV